MARPKHSIEGVSKGYLADTLFALLVLRMRRTVDIAAWMRSTTPNVTKAGQVLSAVGVRVSYMQDRTGSDHHWIVIEDAPSYMDCVCALEVAE